MALRISFFDALELDADRLARQHALDEDRQRSVMRQPLAAVDELVDLDENGFVGLSDLGGHSEMSLTLKAGDAERGSGGAERGTPESSGLRPGSRASW